ncbi:hypothetical protein [Microcystis wesenbergii]|nr:hypothetical protein [Microcystis wesenbergii]
MILNVVKSISPLIKKSRLTQGKLAAKIDSISRWQALELIV